MNETQYLVGVAEQVWLQSEAVLVQEDFCKRKQKMSSNYIMTSTVRVYNTWIKSISMYSNYGQGKASKLKINPYAQQHGLWYVKIDPSQNQDLSTSLERPYKELLNGS